MPLRLVQRRVQCIGFSGETGFVIGKAEHVVLLSLEVVARSADGPAEAAHYTPIYIYT